MAIFMGKFKDGVEHWKIKFGKEVVDYYRREIDGDIPLDRYSLEDGFVHATGFEYWDNVPGCWRTEYEDDHLYRAIFEEDGEA